MIKIKWTCAPVPAGRYRSFEHRGWPFGTIGEASAVQLLCEDEYVPKNVKDGNHAPIKVLIAYRNAENKSFTWRTLKIQANTLDEAKTLAQNWYDRHPEQVQLITQQ